MGLIRMWLTKYCAWTVTRDATTAMTVANADAYIAKDKEQIDADFVEFFNMLKLGNATQKPMQPGSRKSARTWVGMWLDESEAHGFSISHYFVAGVAVRAGQSYTFTFNADTIGSFRVFCDIFCAIHPLMQNGLLIVR